MLVGKTRTHTVSDVQVTAGVYEKPDDLCVVVEHGQVKR